MKSSKESTVPTLALNSDDEQRRQFLFFALRVADALKEFWWIILLIWWIFSYASSIQYTVTELQAKYAGLEDAVTEVRHSQTSMEESIGKIELQISSSLAPLQKDVENTKLGLQEVKATINDIQKDIKTLLAR